MEEDRARRIVDALRERGTEATIAKAGVYQFGIRIALGDGPEAEWDTDATRRAATPPPSPPLPVAGGVFRRFLDGFRYTK